MKRAIPLLVVALGAGCGGDVTAPPTTANTAREPDAVTLSLKPDANEYVYELIIEQRTTGADAVMSILEIELQVMVTRFESGRVRFNFAVARADATTGTTRESQTSDPQRASRVRSLRWSSKHSPNGSVVDLTASSDTERILDTLGARYGVFGVAYPTHAVKPQRTWRLEAPGVEWQLASAADWLATLEGTVAMPATPDAPERTQSVRARVQLGTGMPIEMVGDEAITLPGADSSVLRHWTLSLVG